jgi:hypothetical protein
MHWRQTRALCQEYLFCSVPPLLCREKVSGNECEREHEANSLRKKRKGANWREKISNPGEKTLTHNLSRPLRENMSLCEEGCKNKLVSVREAHAATLWLVSLFHEHDLAVHCRRVLCADPE